MLKKNVHNNKMTKFIICWKYGGMVENLVFQCEGKV
jgi:hypothetical protein